MPARRTLTMRNLRRILRLHHEGASAREIVRAAGVARSTVQDALKRTKSAKLSWPLRDELTDEELESRLFARSGSHSSSGVRKRPEPVWGELVRELRRPAVTMMILWEEYRQAWPAGYGYSRFCELLRDFQQRLSPVMRQHHVAGDKLFVDYSGKRLGISNPLTGEIRLAEICSSSTIGAPRPSTPIAAATCSRSSRIATTAAPFSSQAKFRSTAGTK